MPTIELVITAQDDSAGWRLCCDGQPVASGQTDAARPALAALAAALQALLALEDGQDDPAGRAARLAADAGEQRLSDADAARILRQALESEAGALVASALVASGARLTPLALPPGWLDDFFHRQQAKRRAMDEGDA